MGSVLLLIKGFLLRGTSDKPQCARCEHKVIKTYIFGTILSTTLRQMQIIKDYFKGTRSSVFYYAKQGSKYYGRRRLFVESCHRRVLDDDCYYDVRILMTNMYFGQRTLLLIPK